MLANIVATIGLFIGLIYTSSIVIRLPLVGKPIKGAGIPASMVVWAAIGWTIFASAMWIF